MEENLSTNESNQGESKRKLLSPKIDVVFQILFGEVGDENITADLLSTILDEKIESVQLNENIVLRREFPSDKMGIVDVLAKINGEEYCNIEMQLTNKENIIKRLLYYWSKQYIKGIKTGNEYEELKRMIVILIADFEIKGLEEAGFQSKWKVIEEKERKLILTEDMEINIIELPKMYRDKGEEKEKLKQWLYFLENPESKEVASFMKENEKMKQAKEKLDTMSEDARVRRLAELREKAILDEKEAKYTGYCEGKREGYKEGREEGRKDGRENAQIETAKKMKEKGLDIDLIIEITGLSKERIEIL